MNQTIQLLILLGGFPLGFGITGYIWIKWNTYKESKKQKLTEVEQ